MHYMQTMYIIMACIDVRFRLQEVIDKFDKFDTTTSYMTYSQTSELSGCLAANMAAWLAGNYAFKQLCT